MWCADSSLITVPQDTDKPWPAACVRLSDHHQLSCDPKLGRRRRYRSDLSDTAWARIARFLALMHPRGGRPCPPERWREYLDAIVLR